MIDLQCYRVVNWSQDSVRLLSHPTAAALLCARSGIKVFHHTLGVEPILRSDLDVAPLGKFTCGGHPSDGLRVDVQLIRELVARNPFGVL